MMLWCFCEKRSHSLRYSEHSRKCPERSRFGAARRQESLNLASQQYIGAWRKMRQTLIEADLDITKTDLDLDLEDAITV
jgi:hypothetical protein